MFRTWPGRVQIRLLTQDSTPPSVPAVNPEEHTQALVGTSRIWPMPLQRTLLTHERAPPRKLESKPAVHRHRLLSGSNSVFGRRHTTAEELAAGALEMTELATELRSTEIDGEAVLAGTLEMTELTMELRSTEIEGEATLRLDSVRLIVAGTMELRSAEADARAPLRLA